MPMHQDEDDVIERRTSYREESLHALFQMIRENQATFVEFQKSFNALTLTVSSDSARLQKHMDEEEGYYRITNTKLAHLEAHADKVEILFHAFPTTEDGDIDVHGHRNDHTTRKDEAQDKKEFWRDIWKAVIQYGLITLLGIFVVITGLGIKDFMSYYFKPQPQYIQEHAPHLPIEQK